MQYVYKHPEKEEYVEVSQGMNETHEYENDEGVKFVRVFTSPNMAIDTQINPFSKREFVEKTANKKGTVGDLMDFTKELSHKRADKEGKDVVRQKYLDDYAKARHGTRHYLDKPEKIETKHASVSF